MLDTTPPCKEIAGQARNDVIFLNMRRNAQKRLLRLRATSYVLVTPHLPHPRHAMLDMASPYKEIAGQARNDVIF
jgi:hypothetical protein